MLKAALLAVAITLGLCFTASAQELFVTVDNIPANRGESAHEFTHGVNSWYRNKIAPQGGVNAFYVGDKKICVLNEPPTTLKEVAGHVPQSMRGKCYAQYIISQSKDWDSQSLYILDELNSYVIGCEDYRKKGDIPNARNSLDYALQQQNHALVLLAVLRSKSYADPRLVSFVGWNAHRVAALYVQAVKEGWVGEDSKNALFAIQSQPDALWLKNFCVEQLGKKWCSETLGITAQTTNMPSTTHPTNPVVMLDFTATWCVPCQRMNPTIDALINAGRSVVRVDIDKQHDVATQYKISIVPTLLFLQGGREIKRFVGVTSKETLEAEFRRWGKE